MFIIIISTILIIKIFFVIIKFMRTSLTLFIIQIIIKN